MNNISSRRKVFFIASLAALYIPAIYILSYQYYSATETDQDPIQPVASSESEHESLKNEVGKSGKWGIKNSTLGFEKVFYISMPE